jgi:hypothetical protein
MGSESIIVIRNPSRRLVPAGIAASVFVMFVPPLALSAVYSTETAKAVLGAVSVALVACYFAFSAWKAPVEGRFAKDGITLRSGKESHYELSQIRRWFFAVPNGLPTQSAPGTNAVLHLQMSNGVRFRGEVTSEEAAMLSDRLPNVAIANAIAD